jgi:DNA-binding transcriptional LysR family regulator
MTGVHILVFMDVRHLEHFIALCENGTFGRASEAVCLSQSALSRSIQALESELGLTLFDRLTHGTVMTPAGRMLQPTVRRILSDVGEMRRQAELFRTGDFVELRIGASPSPSAVLMRPLLAKLMSTRPALRVDAQTAHNQDLVDGLRASKFDIVVLDMTHLEDSGDLVVEPLEPQEGNFWVRAGHPLLGRGQLSVDDLQPYPVMGANFPASFRRRLAESLGAAVHPSGFVSVLCDDYAVQHDLVLRTNAVIVALTSIVAPDVEAGRIVALPLRHLAPQPKGLYAMVRVAGRSSSPSLDLVQQIIREEFRRTTARADSPDAMPDPPGGAGLATSAG